MFLGMKAIIRYIFCVLIVSSMFYISEVNEAMGIWGSFYFFSAFFSFLLQTYTNIFPIMDSNIKSDFYGTPMLDEYRNKKRKNINNYWNHSQ